MNIANKNIQRLVITTLIMFFFLPQVNAENIFLSLSHLTQNQNEQQQLELSNGQIRSRVEHRIINYLLGETIDQYLVLGADDEPNKKGSQHLKLRLSEHHIVFVYQHNFQ